MEWTRIIEHKWFEFGKDAEGNDLPKTVISREFSSEWEPGDEPYYPVNDAKNGALYVQYKTLADKEEKVIFGGRLGEFTTSTKMLELHCKSYLPKGMPVEVFKIFADVGTKLWGGFNLKEADACKAVSQTKIPILIIHGDMDNLAPLYMAKEIYNSCKSNKEIYIVHGANHAENYKKDPEGYENVIVQFVGEHSGAFQRTS